MAELKAGCLTTSAAVRGMSPNKREGKEKEKEEEEEEDSPPTKPQSYVFINRQVRA